MRINKTMNSILALSLAFASLMGVAAAQDGRRAIKNPAPTYPQMAKQMHVTGAVRLEVVIAPSGKVSDVKILGGHPLLATYAEQTVKGWQYEASSERTTETVTINFHD